MVDHETGRVIELVKGRLDEDIKPWFAAHPEIEIVTCDRSTDYRKGLDAAAPQATQIADRFHLLMNLRQLAQEIAADAYKRLKQLPVPDDLRAKCPVYARTNSEQRRMDASRQKRLDWNYLDKMEYVSVSEYNRKKNKETSKWSAKNHQKPTAMNSKEMRCVY